MEVLRKTILIVDNEPIIAMAQAEFLKNEGFIVISVPTGEKAIETVRAGGKIDLILIDINLGKGMDGTEAAREIMKEHDMPVLFLSSHMEKEIVEKTEKITSYGYVVKNSGDVVLLASIKMAFRLHEAHRESKQTLKDLIDFLPDATLAINTDKKVIIWNKAIEHMTGVMAKDMVGKGNYEYAIPFYGNRRPILIDFIFQSNEEIAKRYLFVEREGDTLFTETGVPVIKGESRVLAGKASPLYDSKGTIIGAIESIRDVTERERAAEALHQSEARYRSIFENAIEGIFQTMPEGRFIAVNPAMARMHGFSSPEEMVATITSIGEELYVDPEDRVRYRGLLEEHGVVEGFEAQVYRKNGEIIWTSTTSRAVRDSSGKVIRFEGMAKDITARKESEKRLIESEEQYRTAIEHSNDGIALVRGGQHIYVNRKFLEIFGYDKSEDITGNPPFIVVHPDDREMVMEYNLKRQKGESAPSRYEFKGIRKDGAVIFVEVSVAATVHRGEPCSLAYLRDITERRKWENAFLESEENYRLLVENAGLGISVAQDARLVFANTFTSNLTGYTYEEMLSMPFINMIHPDDRNMVYQNYLRRIAGEEPPTRYSFRLERKDGDVRWAEIHAVKTKWKGKSATLNFLSDITDIKEVEEALLKSVEQNNILMKELQHRVKNNLGIISSLLNLEKGKLSDERSKQVFMDAQSRIRSMSRIYEQLYSSTNLGHVNLRLYINDLAQSLFETYAISTGNVRLTINLADINLEIKRAVPLGLILNELITNALKYAYPHDTQGEIRIDLEKSDEKIIFSISDDGVGLPEGFKLEATEGMGMSLVKILTEQIDGELTIEGSKGTKICVTFKI